jgi:hypothetical protein
VKKHHTLSNTAESTRPHSEQTHAPLGRLTDSLLLVGGLSASWVRLDIRMLWTLETTQLVNAGTPIRTYPIGLLLLRKTTET